MRPLVFFSIAAANRFIHSCWASLSVAVPSFITMVLSWAAAGFPEGAHANAAKPRANAQPARRVGVGLDDLAISSSPLPAGRAARADLAQDVNGGATVRHDARGMAAAKAAAGAW